MSSVLTLPTKTLDEALTEVEARFLLNLPEEELNSPERLFFQIEQAYWYYEDFKADRYTNLPHYGSLKTFAQKIFQHCELLSHKYDSFKDLFADYSSYKSKIPVCGCVLLNPAMTKVVLVCDWGGKSWMFPRGKINQNETEIQCAIRETFEETGFNAAAHCNQQDFLTVFQDQKKVQLYIAKDVSEETVFQCQTIKEVSEIAFHPLDQLPQKTFGVHPFIPKLKRWINQQRKLKNKQTNSTTTNAIPAGMIQPQKVMLLKRGESLAEKKKAMNAAENAKKDKEKENEKKNKNAKLTPSAITAAAANQIKRKDAKPEKNNAFDARNADTFAVGESAAEKRWSVEQMFNANAKITGRQYDYDGNPHAFGAFHPRYVNYVQSTGTDRTGGNNEDGQDLRKQLSQEFIEFSLQSQRDGQKLLRGIEFAEEDRALPPASSLPATKEKEREKEKTERHTAVRLRRALFVRPFVVNKEEVMSAIDCVLAANPITME